MENNQITSSGQKPNKSIYIKDLESGSELRSHFLVQSKNLMVAKNGKPYLAMTLSDRTGKLDTRVWNDANELAKTFNEGDVVAAWGKVHTFQNRLQFIGEDLVVVPEEEVDLTQFLPKADEDLDALFEELKGIFREVSNPWVSQLALSLLEDPSIAERYKICPAAKTIHHAFLGGLLVHSLQLIKLVDAILPLYEKIDRSLLVFGAAFHDFGKIFELNYQGNFGYSDEGRLVGHIAIGTCLIDRKIQGIDGFPQDLEWQVKHLVLSHHGRLEYGSPKRPATLEAQILANLDEMDSKINSIQTQMTQEGSKERWTTHHRAYDQYYYKSDAFMTSLGQPTGP